MQHQFLVIVFEKFHESLRVEFVAKAFGERTEEFSSLAQFTALNERNAPALRNFQALYYKLIITSLKTDVYDMV